MGFFGYFEIGQRRLDTRQRKFLPQGMIRITVPHQNAAQVWVAFELNPKHIVGLSLVPVGTGPKGDHARHRRSGIIARARRRHAHGRVRRGRIKMVNRRKARRRALSPIDSRDIRQQIKTRLIAQRFQCGDQIRRRNIDRRTIAAGAVGHLRKFSLEGAEGVDGSGHR